MLKFTPLRAIHAQLGATLGPFAGWEMPLRYRSELAEHQAVRTQAALFDLSHMGEFLVRGSQAKAFLQKMLSNDAAKLSPGRAQYTFLLNPDGGILDDLIVYCLEEELYLLVVNAATTAKDRAWLEAHLPASGVTLEDISEDTVLLALSGPESTAILGRLTVAPIADMPYYSVRKAEVAGIPQVLIATTGYTGEWTYELFVRAKHGADLWEALQAQGVSPAGLAARNTLRLEMGYLLYGTDIDESTTPLEAGVEWAVKLHKEEFIGKSALLRQKAQGLKRRLVGLRSESVRALPRNGMPLLNSEGQPIGRITSGSISPTLQCGIALGYVPVEVQLGETVYFELRGQRWPLAVVKPPFVSSTSLQKRLQAQAK
ncbi:MAG: glycine cleavage system aminomethyltransferase GcvT [Bacteroidia bacterium]